MRRRWRYPRLTEAFRDGQATRLACNGCGVTWQGTFEEVSSVMAWPYACPKCGKFEVVVAYDLADRCKGCGRLGFYHEDLDFCCSRRCMLIAEYAEFLRGRWLRDVGHLPWRGYRCV